MYKRNLAFSDYSILKNNLVLHNPHFTREGVFLLQLYAYLLTTNVPHHIETSQLVCIANQVTGLYMMGNSGC